MAGRPYAKSLFDLVNELAGGLGDASHPLLATPGGATLDCVEKAAVDEKWFFREWREDGTLREEERLKQAAAAALQRDPGAVAEAEQERAAFVAAKAMVPADTLYNLNPASTILTVADGVLSARIAGAKGQTEEMLAAWKRAIAAEDTLAYNEPPDWFYPTRESLGGALLKLKRYEAADLIFREDLERVLGAAGASLQRGEPAPGAALRVVEQTLADLTQSCGAVLREERTPAARAASAMARCRTAPSAPEQWMPGCRPAVRLPEDCRAFETLRAPAISCGGICTSAT